MNGISLTENNLADMFATSSLAVLETMFFADAMQLDGSTDHVDPLACLLHCSGPVEGTFSVAIDRTALVALCEAFYGEDAPSATQLFELLCEFTNMIAGSTLSVYSPSRFCPLSSPQLCDAALHLESAELPDATFLRLAVEGGLISIACSLRTK
jgi:hypothetical protein